MFLKARGLKSDLASHYDSVSFTSSMTLGKSDYL